MKQSINKRFSNSIVKIVALILLVFTLGVGIYGVKRMNSSLDDQLSYISKLGQTSLRGAIWNMDDDAIDEILSALFLDKDIAYLAVVSNEKITAEKTRPLFEGKKFSFFEKSPEFITTPAPINFEGQEIGKVRIVISKSSLKRDLITQVASIILLALILILMITRRSIKVFQRIIFKPLIELENSASAIAKGNLDINIPCDRDDEIGSLGKSFEEMRGSVEKLITDLNTVNAGLEKRVKERTAELEVLNETKNKFLGMAAHDLRNPLTSIRGFSEMLQDSSLDKETKDEFLGYIHSVSDEMLSLLNNLLDVSQIESGQLTLSLKLNNIGDLVKRRVHISENIARKKQIVLKSEVGDCPEINFDSEKLSQVIDNFISNAIKFSPSGTTITVRSSLLADNIRVEVQDEGPGIPAEEVHKLFGDFQKLSTRPTAGEKSTGLGLAIVKRIVKAHDGEIGVESEVGKGSIFFFSLPTS